MALALQGALERIADAGSAIGSMVDNVRSMSRDTHRIEDHAKHLDTIDERLDRIVDLMERMVASVDELRSSVEQLQEHVEPVGRLAGRFPGRRREG
jgi:methyl-accepting chemotaxis protein